MENNEDLILVNIIEEFVKLQVKSMAKELGACDCQACYLNACAIALNSLPPKYVTTTKGALFSKLDETEMNHQAGVTVAVTKAIMHVMENQRH